MKSLDQEIFSNGERSLLLLKSYISHELEKVYAINPRA